MEITPEQAAILERQVEYFRSDQRIRDQVEVWRDATPRECLEALDESCKEAEFFLARLDDEALERALEPDPLPSDAIAILSELCRRR